MKAETVDRRQVIPVDSDGQPKGRVAHTAHRFDDYGGSAFIHGWLGRMHPSFALTSALRKNLIQERTRLIQNLRGLLLSCHDIMKAS